MSGPFPVGVALWGPVLLAVLALGFAVFGLFRPRGLAGLLALLLTALAAGGGVFVQVRAEREVDRFLLTGGQPENRAALERMRLYRYPHAQALGRKVALLALLPLLLGAVAALRRPLGGRVLPLGFVGLAVLAWASAWRISHRPLPVDRYDFAEDDDETWMLAIAIDGAADRPDDLSDWGSHCGLLDVTVRQYRQRTPVPPTLEGVLQVAAQRCVQATLAALDASALAGRDPKVVSAQRRALVDSVLLEDQALRERLAHPPDPGETERLEARVRARARLRDLLGPGPPGVLEEVLAGADAGVP